MSGISVLWGPPSRDTGRDIPSPFRSRPHEHFHSYGRRNGPRCVLVSRGFVRRSRSSAEMFTSGAFANAASAREPQPLTAITAVQHALPPLTVIQIPLHRLAQARFEALLRPPAELAFDLARVDGVTLVVAGPVRDEGDELRMGPVCRLRQQFVEQRAKRLNLLLNGALVVPPDVVGLADLPFFQNPPQGARMVFHKETIDFFLVFSVFWL